MNQLDDDQHPQGLSTGGHVQLECPADWVTRPIGELGDVKLGRQSAPKYRTGAGIRPYLRVVNVSDGRLDLRDVKEMDFTDEDFDRYALASGDVLLTEGDLVSAANVGRSAVYRGEIEGCCFQNTLLRFRSGPAFTSLFAHHAFCFLRAQGCFAVVANGTTVFHLGSGRLKEVLAPVPPAGEQRKIAAILTSVDDAIEATEAVIDQLHLVEKAIMAELLTRGPPGRHTRFKQTEIGEVPEEWRYEVLRAVCVADGLQTGPFGSQLMAGEYTTDGVPVIMPRDIVNQRISTDTIARVSRAKAESLPQHRVVRGDIVFGRRGDIGRCALVGDGEEGWLCGTGCLRARLDTSNVDPEFLARWVGSARVVAWLNEHAVGQTMLNLNTEILGDMPVVLPPLPEQSEIGRGLAEFDHSLAACGAEIQALRDLKSALMSVLLTGEVRVTPDEAAA